MARLSIDQFTNFFVWYKGLPHQDMAIAELWKLMPVSLLEDDADWIQTYRDPAIEEDPEVPVVISGKENENSWGGVLAAAKKLGRSIRRWWRRSGRWSQPGASTPAGITTPSALRRQVDEPYSTCTTWEHYDGKDVTIQAKFRDFESLQECIDDLVAKWYKDYKGYKGVNRAESVGECCQLLRQEGYATDPHYSSKLMSIINRQAG